MRQTKQRRFAFMSKHACTLYCVCSLLGAALCVPEGCAATSTADSFDNSGGAGGAGAVGGGGGVGGTTAVGQSVTSTAAITSSSAAAGGASPTSVTSASSTSGTSTTSSSVTSAASSSVTSAASSSATSAASSSATSAASSSTSAGAGGSVAGSVYSDDFEGDTLATQATGWTRVGGSGGDWAVVKDGTQAFAQNHAMSSTLRVCYAGPVESTAETVSAQVKITAMGSSGTTTAMLCIRYPAGGGTPYACLALEAGVGAQIKTGGTDGPLWATTVAVGTWYTVKLSLDGSGMLTADVDGTLLGTFMPSPLIASGSIAIATLSAEAEFDDVVLTTP